MFATRSPDRPNPIGLHTVEVLAIDGSRLHAAPLEAISGTPVIGHQARALNGGAKVASAAAAP